MHKIAAIKAAIGPEEAATIFWDEIRPEYQPQSTILILPFVGKLCYT